MGTGVSAEKDIKVELRGHRAKGDTDRQICAYYPISFSEWSELGTGREQIKRKTQKAVVYKGMDVKLSTNFFNLKG